MNRAGNYAVMNNSGSVQEPVFVNQRWQNGLSSGSRVLPCVARAVVRKQGAKGIRFFRRLFGHSARIDGGDDSNKTPIADSVLSWSYCQTPAAAGFWPAVLKQRMSVGVPSVFFGKRRHFDIYQMPGYSISLYIRVEFAIRKVLAYGLKNRHAHDYHRSG